MSRVKWKVFIFYICIYISYIYIYKSGGEDRAQFLYTTTTTPSTLHERTFKNLPLSVLFPSSLPLSFARTSVHFLGYERGCMPRLTHVCAHECLYKHDFTISLPSKYPPPPVRPTSSARLFTISFASSLTRRGPRNWIKSSFFSSERH